MQHDARCWAWSFWVGQLPAPVSGSEAAGSPRFLGNLAVPKALLSDPGRIAVPKPIRGSDTAPVSSKAEAPTTSYFRGSIAQPWHSLSTLRPDGRPIGRKTRFRLLARLYRAGLITHKVP